MKANDVMRWGLIAVLAAGVGLGFGCGDDDASAGSGADGGAKGAAGKGGGGSSAPSTVEPGDSTSVDIDAAKGGEVALGEATLSIPAGALADDTTITVEVLDKSKQPGAADIVADVYDFGPDGTEFLKPVTLEFDVGALKVPSGKQAMIAFLDGGEWTALEDSELAGGAITATTTHFTPFTVVFVALADGGVKQVGGACDIEGFEACGGDLVGTWEYTGACVTVPPGALGGGGDGGSPFAMCTDQPTLAATVDLTGTTTFNDDGTYSLDQEVTITSEVVIPASCLDDLTMGQLSGADACTQFVMGDLDADGNCVGSPGDPEMSSSSSMGTWSADGGKLMIVETGPDAGAPSTDDVQYCVKGDTVTVTVKDADNGFTIQYVATRK